MQADRRNVHTLVSTGADKPHDPAEEAACSVAKVSSATGSRERTLPSPSPALPTERRRAKPSPPLEASSDSSTAAPSKKLTCYCTTTQNKKKKKIENSWN